MRQNEIFAESGGINLNRFLKNDRMVDSFSTGEMFFQDSQNLSQWHYLLYLAELLNNK